MLIDLATFFPDAKGYATESIARKKLERTCAGADFARSSFVTVQRPTDGRWLAIVVLGTDDTWRATFLARSNICVTN